MATRARVYTATPIHICISRIYICIFIFLYFYKKMRCHCCHISNKSFVYLPFHWQRTISNALLFRCHTLSLVINLKFLSNLVRCQWCPFSRSNKRLLTLIFIVVYPHRVFSFFPTQMFHNRRNLPLLDCCKIPL